MDFTDFEEISRDEWSSYFSRVSIREEAGEFECSVYYPNILLVTKTPRHYIMELYGVSKTFKGLSVKSHRARSLELYFNQMEVGDDSHTPTCKFSKHHKVDGWIFANTLSFPSFENRLKYINQSGRPKIVSGWGGALKFSSRANNIFFNDVFTVSRDDVRLRVKYCLAALVIRSDMFKRDYKKLLASLFNGSFGVKNHEVLGITWGDSGEDAIHKHAQFQNIYLSENLRETTIGEFLNRHPEFVKSAFDVDDFRYEPTFKWMAPGDEAVPDINPDLMLRRSDGFYDICDIKLALLGVRSLTIGKVARRRFIAKVNEGIAQLAHYADYFNYEENARYAKEKFGVEVSNPKLILLTGNLENFNSKHVLEACRATPNVIVTDYDSLADSYLLKIKEANRKSKVREKKQGKKQDIYGRSPGFKAHRTGNPKNMDFFSKTFRSRHTS